jgi:AcrR family transcriptional regulator
MSESKHSAESGPTYIGVQDRLLWAAEELFCERGFKETSVRDIAAAADCNVASINYYFGGKENLYVAMWRRYFELMRETRLASIEQVMSDHVAPELEALLRSYAHSFVEPLVDGGHSCRFMNLVAREMIDPHLPRDMFLEEMAVPVMTALSQALQRICPGLEESRIRLLILSIVGQLMHAVLAKEMFEQSEQFDVPELDLGEIVDHVVQFSAAGIRACAVGTEEKAR